MKGLWVISLLFAGAAAAQTLSGPVQDHDLDVGQEAPPVDRNQGPPGAGPDAALAPPFAPVTALRPGDPLVPRPAPGSVGGEEARRLRLLPSVQITPVYPSDRTGDGMSAEGLEPASYARGELVAMGGGLIQNAGNACITCHGIDGAGDGSGAIPRLAGQPAWYLAKQLRSYEEGTRESEVMEQVAETLSRQDQIDVALYYSAVEARFPPERQLADPGMLQHGAVLSSRGISEREIPACENCHATDAAGIPPAVPYLQGQYASYIAAQLYAWQDRRRVNDEGAVMRAVADKMTDRDIEAVAVYLESLRPLEPGIAGDVP